MDPTKFHPSAPLALAIITFIALYLFGYSLYCIYTERELRMSFPVWTAAMMGLTLALWPSIETIHWGVRQPWGAVCITAISLLLYAQLASFVFPTKTNEEEKPIHYRRLKSTINLSAYACLIIAAAVTMYVLR